MAFSAAWCARNLGGGTRGYSARQASLIRTLAATCSCIAITLPAAADDRPPPLSFSITAVSQYVFRGLTQTNRQPALQGEADLSSASGWYAGSWLSNVSWYSDAVPGVSTPVEWDLYGGDRLELAGGLGLDVGVMRYAYPGRYRTLPVGTVSPNMTELYVGASWRWATLKYSRAVTNTNGVEHSVGSNYLDLTVSAPITARLRANAHAGRQRFSGHNGLTAGLGTSNDGLYGYCDYTAGLSVTVAGDWLASLSYTGTSATDAGYLVRGRNLGSAHLVAGLARTF